MRARTARVARVARRLHTPAGFHYTHAVLRTRITTIILDFGGVLGLPQDPVRQAAMAALCGLSPEAFSRLYFRDRLELDRGTLPTDGYWSQIFREAGVEPTPALIARIEEEDSLGWTRINWPVVAWADELRAAGYSTAILSNMPCDKLAWMRKNPDCSWMGAFPVAVFSCEHRLVKPEAAIYRRCLELLGREGAECLFLDDSRVNVEGALAAGITSIQFLSAAETGPVISREWGLPVRSLLDGAR